MHSRPRAGLAGSGSRGLRRLSDGGRARRPSSRYALRSKSIRVARLNHAVRLVRDTGLAIASYWRVFGFEVVGSEMDGRAVFLPAAGGDNHHDLRLFAVGPDAPSRPRGSVGLYHLAWEVPTIEDLAAAERVLSEKHELGGASDHGVSKSLYGHDPDDNEFEIMWRVTPAALPGPHR